MTTNELIEHLQPGELLVVQNESFHYVGKAELQLHGGDMVCWLYDKEKAILSINLETDEIFIFWPLEEEIDLAEDVVVIGTDQYEIFYEDKGKVRSLEGDHLFDENERFHFTDYQNEEGRILRVISLQSTGQEYICLGSVLLEEEIFSHED